MDTFIFLLGVVRGVLLPGQQKDTYETELHVPYGGPLFQKNIGHLEKMRSVSTIKRFC